MLDSFSGDVISWEVATNHPQASPLRAPSILNFPDRNVRSNVPRRFYRNWAVWNSLIMKVFCNVRSVLAKPPRDVGRVVLMVVTFGQRQAP